MHQITVQHTQQKNSKTSNTLAAGKIICSNKQSLVSLDFHLIITCYIGNQVLTDAGILKGCCSGLELIIGNESCLEQGTSCDKTFLKEIIS